MKRNLTLLLPLSASALESATVGSQATQATVSVLNSKIDSVNAVLQATNVCNAKGSFYSPGHTGADANGCWSNEPDFQVFVSGTNNSRNHNWTGTGWGGAASGNSPLSWFVNAAIPSGWAPWGWSINPWGLLSPLRLPVPPRPRFRRNPAELKNQRYHSRPGYLSARSRPASVEFRRDRDVGMAEDILHDAQIARLA